MEANKGRTGLLKSRKIAFHNFAFYISIVSKNHFQNHSPNIITAINNLAGDKGRRKATIHLSK